MNFYRLKDGRVTDIWTQFDGATLMQQLGAPGLTLGVSDSTLDDSWSSPSSSNLSRQD